MTAIALHAEPAADRALQSLAAAGQPDALRRKAIFWLGNARGRSGFLALDRIVREDKAPHVRGQNPAVRKQAFFWLGQSKDARALSFFEEVLNK